MTETYFSVILKWFEILTRIFLTAPRNYPKGKFPGRPVYDVEDEKVRPGKSMSARPRAERNLIKKLLEYSVVLGEAVSEFAPHKVANYLYELAQSFSRFYEGCPVIGCDREKERLKLVQVYLEVMTHGLNILGITIPEEM